MILSNLFIAVLSALLLLPCSVLLFQVLAAMLPARHPMLSRQTAVESFVDTATEVCLLMPAHNEASGIHDVLSKLLPQLSPGVRLLVVADNCTDDTASIVRGFHVNYSQIEVIERTNVELRGKGYALDYGVRHLGDRPPQVVLVLDADCVIEPGSIATLTSTCLSSGRPTQALYLMRSSPESSIKTLVAEFAWLVKNQVRATGFHRLGLPCPLMGTGMAFSWQQISTAQLASGNIVEDLQLGIELSRAGTPPQFCPEALVTSYFPTMAEGLVTQRTRWEHGHMGVMISEFPKLLKQSLLNGNGTLLAIALDLCVPPLALLTLLVSALILVGAVVGAVLGSWLPLAIGSLPGAALVVAVMMAWFAFGRQVITLRQLSSVPMYVLAKIPLYARFLIKRQTNWVRARRDGE
ncbi:MAG: glycosyltransferase [Rhodoferax sp.]